MVASWDHGDPGQARNAAKCDQATLEFINMYLAAEADGFIGPFSTSSFARLVVRLSYAIHTPKVRPAICMLSGLWTRCWNTD